jgi:S1-C subfamily serine protease
VAGETDTVVQVGSSHLDAHAIAFDPREDVAVLDVPGLSLAPLALAPDVPAGREGAIVGYPQDGSEEIRAARVGQTQTINTQDAYGNGDVPRLITPFRGVVRPGNSGGPVVDARGRVLTTVFAAVTGGGAAAGFGVANATVAQVLAHAGAAVSTGPCAD